MIKITDEQLNYGLNLAHNLSICPSSLFCLWGKVNDSCEEQKSCKLILFRKTLESDSPAFYGKFKELSEYEAVMHDLVLVEVEGNIEQKSEVRARFGDLNVFAQLSMVALYSLFVANEPPFLSSKEIKEIEQNHDFIDLQRINSNWFAWINIFLSNFQEAEKPIEAISLLVRLYAYGNLPIQPLILEEDKEKLFSDIVAHFLNTKKK